MNGKIAHLKQCLLFLRAENSHNFNRALEFAELIISAAKMDPTIWLELSSNSEQINRHLKTIALKRGWQLVEYLRSNFRLLPPMNARSDADEIRLLIEKGFVSYGDIHTSLAEIQKLSRGSNQHV